MRDYFKEFIKSEQSSGIVLIICTVISLILANSAMSDSYLGFFKSYIGPESLGLKLTVVYWINDLLMAVFFLLVGLEIKREFANGELSSFKRAILPIFVAIGGMAVPAIIYTLKNAGTPTASGWGIPMATDIAFALGIIALAGKAVPKSLKVFLVALAVVDDLGAILVIAIFYTANLGVTNLMYAGICLVILFIINRLKVKNIFIYFIPGIFLWYFVFQSGIHATIAGVLLALTIPISKRYNDSPLHKLEHALHKPVNFLVMPVFALANTAIVLDASFISALTSNYSLGIILGLFIGKPLGVFIFTYALIKMKVTNLPQGSSWGQVIGTGFIAGIGFTMSIFICTLAFNDPEIIERAKLSILVASLMSGIVGFILLKSASKGKAYV
ncbi:MAG TPA: Na+/H+ antiporter NhaA [Bacteroidetes bacterium]|nr:Na+/H+ antiporter NhaA [Bacteroidota bacterium]HCN37236.1 Na+/H+ antiporter NhaA [Bacteroidota bacterium]